MPIYRFVDVWTHEYDVAADTPEEARVMARGFEFDGSCAELAATELLGEVDDQGVRPVDQPRLQAIQ